MQVPVSYAFRCKPWEMYLLTEGAISYPSRPQVCVFGKKEIVPGFLDEYCVLDAKNFNDKRYFTNFGEEVFAHNPIIQKTYVARVDTQIEFVCSEELFEALHKTALPAIHHNASITYFIDETTGFLTMLRVYEIDRSIDDALMAKGRQGSAVIIKLYDSQANDVSVNAVLGKPVISDGLFDYLRDEIIHIVKSRGALLGVYHNDPKGRAMLQEIGDLRRSMQPKRTYDLDASEDRAKHDYNRLYKRIICWKPQMCNLIDYISNVRPAQFGEIPVLYEEAIAGKCEAYKRLIDVHLRSILRLADTYARVYHVDIEDLFQEGVHGLQLAIPRYDPAQSTSTFSAYASYWEKQSMQRNVILHHHDRYVPVHMMEKLIKASDIIKEHQCEFCTDDDAMCPTLLKNIMDVIECEHEQAVLLVDLSCASVSFDAMEHDDENGCILYKARFGTWNKPVTSPFSDNGLIIETVEERIEADILKVTVQQALEALSDRELEIIRKRYGFDGAPQTLEEIGLALGVTRERIRQIEVKAIKKLGHHRSIIAKKYRSQYKKTKQAKNSEASDIPDQKNNQADERLPILSFIALRTILENHGIIFSVNRRDKSYVWISQDNISTKKLNELKKKYVFNLSNYQRGWRISPVEQ